MSSLAQPTPSATPRTVGDLIRSWRLHRRLSQLDLASAADISTRHLSYVETGRAAPSRAMVMHLAERLAVPLRERNQLLAAAGFAPLYRERPLADPALAAAREAVDQVLKAHEPWPALAVDRHWHMVSHNATVPLLLEGVDAALVQGPINVLRLSLHPGGLAPRIANLPTWRAHLLHRLAQQVEATADPVLAALLDELSAYPAPQPLPDLAPSPGRSTAASSAPPCEVSPAPLPLPTDEPVALAINAIAVPLQLRTPGGVLSFISTTTVFGSPVDITLAELAMETFFPADPFTAEALRTLVRG